MSVKRLIGWNAVMDELLAASLHQTTAKSARPFELSLYGDPWTETVALSHRSSY